MPGVRKVHSSLTVSCHYASSTQDYSRLVAVTPSIPGVPGEWSEKFQRRPRGADHGIRRLTLPFWPPSARS